MDYKGMMQFHKGLGIVSLSLCIISGVMVADYAIKNKPKDSSSYHYTSNPYQSFKEDVMKTPPQTTIKEDVNNQELWEKRRLSALAIPSFLCLAGNMAFYAYAKKRKEEEAEPIIYIQDGKIHRIKK